MTRSPSRADRLAQTTVLPRIQASATKRPPSALLPALLACASLTGLASSVSSQAERTSFVFDVYVDPLHGDDRLAGNQTWVFNPTAAGQHAPLADHPAAVPPQEPQPGVNSNPGRKLGTAAEPFVHL